MIEQIANQIFNDIKEKLNGLDEALAPSKIKPLIEANLRKLNLVTREEFDAQQAVLVRTREKLEALEAKIAELESGNHDAQ